MTRMLAGAPAVFMLMAIATPGCGGDSNNPAPTTPTPPAVTVTENFTGTLAQGASARHPFTVKAQGLVTVTLTAIGPLNTLAVGLGIGTWDGTSCTLVAQNANARQGNALSGSALAGNFCAAVFDVGNITEPITYTLDVVHP